MTRSHATTSPATTLARVLGLDAVAQIVRPQLQ
jgi:hypothetical protein